MVLESIFSVAATVYILHSRELVTHYYKLAISLLEKLNQAIRMFCIHYGMNCSGKHGKVLLQSLETETTFHYCWRVKFSLKLVWVESWNLPPHATH